MITGCDDAKFCEACRNQLEFANKCLAIKDHDNTELAELKTERDIVIKACADVLNEVGTSTKANKIIMEALKKVAKWRKD